jgi:hypothetical protein
MVRGKENVFIRYASTSGIIISAYGIFNRIGGV